MKRSIVFLCDDIFVSAHSFNNDELLVKFQYRVLNTVLFVMAVFSLLFATLSLLDINPIGSIQTTTNFILASCALTLMYWLRGPRSRYMPTAYMMYTVAYAAFIMALLFVPNDEFRIIWFYLLVLAAYITGGVRSGNIVSIVSVITIIVVNNLYDLQLSQTAIISSVLGLVIASLFIRAYAKKIVDYENELNEQKSIMIKQSRFAAMGEMMSMVAHQWRQPLSTTTLMISNERIKLMLDGKEESEYDEVLDKISNTMIYLSDTIEDFQTYFKPNKKSQYVSTCELVERAHNFVKTRLEMDKIDLHINTCKDEMIDLYVNEVVQVLINMINNAIDALVENNVVDKEIWVNIQCDDEYVYINIEDNAGGIEDEIISKIFEPYFSTKSKNGTGLGLYMSKMIIEKHANGKIDVLNTSKGACFTISLPKK